MPQGPYSPAALRLMGEGITFRRIAGALGTTEATVSRWLHGHHPPRPELWTAIAALGGPALADEVRALIPDRRAVVQR